MQQLFFENMALLRRGYNRMIDPVCQQWQLTRREADILLYLTRYPEQNRSADIVAMGSMTKSHVSLSVKHLKALGYLVQGRDNDRRTSRLYLTQAALPAIRAVQAAQQIFFNQILEGVSQQELAVFQQLNQTVSRNLEALNREMGI